MENANFILTEDNVPVYQTYDVASGEVAKLHIGDEILCDEKFKKNRIEWISVILPDGRKGYIPGDSKGIKIKLMILTQPNADAFETPDSSAKIIFTYREGDKLQVIGSEKKDGVLWLKTESLSGVIGFMPGSVKAKEEIIITPMQKWPARIGVAMGFIGVALELLIYFTSNNHSGGGTLQFEIVFAFFAAGIPAYLLTLLFIKVKRSMFR